jgi:phage portal protein BeeE
MNWWFGRKAAPADVRPFVPAWLTAGVGGGFAQSFQAQFDEVYRRNPVGQRAVRLVAGMTGALPVYSGDELSAKLVKAELLETVAANLLLHGNAYVQAIGDGDEIVELVTLRPERVSVVADERGWPSGYLYRAGGRVQRFDRVDELGRISLAHIRSLHPRDDHYGMGCLDAACPAASVHNGASKWNKALLDNAARPSGALVYDPGDGSTLSDTQMRQLREEMPSNFPGAAMPGGRCCSTGG